MSKLQLYLLVEIQILKAKIALAEGRLTAARWHLEYAADACAAIQIIEALGF